MQFPLIQNELVLKATRSGGKGGQNVNKVATKVELYFNIAQSQGLSEEEKLLVATKLANRINKEGILILASQEDRSQLGNRELVVQKLEELLTRALIKKKKRKPTKVPKGVKEARIQSKKKRGEVKSTRGKTNWRNSG